MFSLVQTFLGDGGFAAGFEFVGGVVALEAAGGADGGCCGLFWARDGGANVNAINDKTAMDRRWGVIVS